MELPKGHKRWTARVDDKFGIGCLRQFSDELETRKRRAGLPILNFASRLPVGEEDLFLMWISKLTDGATGVEWTDCNEICEATNPVLEEMAKLCGAHA